MTDCDFADAIGVVGAQLYFDAKIKEFEAACFGGSKARCNEAEENCRSALQALLDAKASNTVAMMKRFRQS
jgi:hypothetical protein